MALPSKAELLSSFCGPALSQREPCTLPARPSVSAAPPLPPAPEGPSALPFLGDRADQGLCNSFLRNLAVRNKRSYLVPVLGEDIERKQLNQQAVRILGILGVFSPLNQGNLLQDWLFYKKS